MKFKIGCFLAAVIIFQSIIAVAVFAGSFSWLQGTLNYDYQNFTQHGADGFFGPYNVDQSVLEPPTNPSDYASVNGWLGSSVVSGSVAGANTGSLIMVARINFNDAITAIGYYGPANWYVGESIANPRWLQWRVSAKTPLGMLEYGKYTLSRGLGLQFSRDEEFITLTIGQRISLYGGKTWNSWEIEEEEVKEMQKGIAIAQDNIDELTLKMESTVNEALISKYRDDILKFLKQIADNELLIGKIRQGYGYPSHRSYFEEANPNLQLTLGFYPWRRQSTRYWSADDLNSVGSINLLGELEYTTRYLTISAGTIYSSFHEGSESQLLQSARSSFNSQDTQICEGWLFSHYANGTGLYFASELDWYYQNTKYHNTPTTLPVEQKQFPTTYVESWRFAALAGLFLGPAEMKLLYVYMPGPDRRQGDRIDRQSFILARNQSASGIFRDYSQILARAYDGGLGGQTNDIPDATTYAIRLNYLIAANLGIGVSVLHAERLSHGYGLGYIRPVITENPTTHTRSLSLNFNTRKDTSGNFPPAIPDNDLGWEFNLFIDWELFQNWQLSFTYGFWQPGKWFNYACIDKSVSGWNVLDTALDWGINPNREIDPVSCVLMKIKAKF